MYHFICPIYLVFSLQLHPLSHMHVAFLVTQSYLTLATPWTVACQAPLSMGLPRQKYWSELLFPPPGHLPDPGIEPASPVSPALQVDSTYWVIREALPKSHLPPPNTIIFHCKSQQLLVIWFEPWKMLVSCCLFFMTAVSKCFSPFLERVEWLSLPWLWECMSAGFLKQGTSLWLAQPKTLLAAFSLLAAFWTVSSIPSSLRESQPWRKGLGRRQDTFSKHLVSMSHQIWWPLLSVSMVIARSQDGKQPSTQWIITLLLLNNFHPLPAGGWVRRYGDALHTTFELTFLLLQFPPTTTGFLYLSRPSSNTTSLGSLVKTAMV